MIQKCLEATTIPRGPNLISSLVIWSTSYILPVWKTMGSSHVSCLTLSGYLLQTEVVLVYHLSHCLKAPFMLQGMRSDLWGAMGKDPQEQPSQTSFYRSTRPLYQISVIVWTLQRLRLIWYIATSLEFYTSVRTDNRLNYVSLPDLNFVFWFIIWLKTCVNLTAGLNYKRAANNFPDLLERFSI